jgi:hypothetical protein
VAATIDLAGGEPNLERLLPCDQAVLSNRDLSGAPVE